MNSLWFPSKYVVTRVVYRRFLCQISRYNHTLLLYNACNAILIISAIPDRSDYIKFLYFFEKSRRKFLRSSRSKVPPPCSYRDIDLYSMTELQEQVGENWGKSTYFFRKHENTKLGTIPDLVGLPFEGTKGGTPEAAGGREATSWALF